MKVLTVDHLVQKHLRWSMALYTVVILGISFQIGHFIEHAVQFGMWVLSDRSSPWMSRVAMWLVHHIGNTVMPMPEICTDPKAFQTRQMVLGMEILHLIGNSIFLVTIASLYHLLPTKLVRLALVIESFHLGEHLMLTLSVASLGKPIGLSTLFGYSGTWLSREGSVGYRVTWHFLMNLIPSVLIMQALMQKQEPLRTASHS